ncbi:hypothetical protein RHGRI_022171 [Rhododendron griersonianum]|uniref:Uncharacterized protein n=1 Tax=Rhododendron griersonianum TaxID=479676 RepID=A0AAV6JRI4_9ERIC|nr:hypothetical protein RHGRI_022171 [Rhododendron griersonianum]
MEDPVSVYESKEVIEKPLDPIGLAAEGVLGLGEEEDVVEVVVDGFEAGQAVAEPRRGSGIGCGSGGGPGFEMVEVVLELIDQGVRSTWETGGSEV